MDITPLIPKDRQVINRYGNGGFVISGVVHKGNILIASHGVFAWAVSELMHAEADSLMPLLTDAEQPEIVLIGAGKKFAPLPAALQALLRERKIAVDVMDTGAACRTYTVLLAEGRLVAAALIAVD